MTSNGHQQNGRGPQRLARALGWASLGLGVPQTLAPQRFDRAVGVQPTDRARLVTRTACGLRELGAGAAILKLEQPRPVVTVWSRVAGDLLDLYLLGASFRSRRSDPARLAVASAAVAGVAALDLYTAVRLTKGTGEDHAEDVAQEERDEEPVATKAVITVRGPQEEVERRWNELHEERPDWLENGTLRFTRAPGDRGTEIHVDFESEPGGIGKVVQKVAGAVPAVKAKDELRRFKQIVETGEVVRSEGTPEGQSALRYFKQRPAQPLESGSEAER